MLSKMHSSVLFLICAATEMALTIKYNPDMRIADLKKLARRHASKPKEAPLCLYEPGQLEGDVSATTVREAGLEPGDVLFIRWG